MNTRFMPLHNIFCSITKLFLPSKFQAHRVVLASCSEYFQAMFTEPMRERGQTDIHLYGVSSVGLEIILNYIYTSNIVLSLANIQPVLSTASQLQMIKVCLTTIFITISQLWYYDVDFLIIIVHIT